MKKNRITYWGASLVMMALAMASCSEDKDFGGTLDEVISISSVIIDPTDYNAEEATICLLKNKELQLSYTIAPENVSTPNLVWTSSDESVATVTQDGKIATKDKTGEAIIRVTPEIGFGSPAATPSRMVRVMNEFVYLESIAVTNLPEEAIATGDEYQLKVSSLPENATFKRYKYESSDPAIATVSQSGLVKGVAKGKVRITVIADDLNPGTAASTSFEMDVKVVIPITRLEFVEDMELSALGYGQDYQVKYTLEPADATASLLKWSSDNDAIGVDKTGQLHVNNRTAGSATITASYGPISKSVKVTIAEGRLCYSFADGLGVWGLEKNHNSSFLKADGEKSTIKLGGSPKGRGDFNLTMNSDGQTVSVTPTSYRYIAVKIAVSSALVSGSNSAGCVKMEMFDNGSATIGNNYVGTVGSPNNSFSLLGAEKFSATDPNIIYYDLQGKFDKKTPGNTVTKIDVSQFKFVMADYPIVTASTYDLYWVRSFKTLEELQDFVTNENNK